MMGRIPILLTIALLTGAVGSLRADLDAVKAEPKLEKRARRAMDNSEKMLDASRAAYRHGQMAEHQAALKEVQESVQLAYQSLKETGKNPRNNSSHYKRGEIRSRKLLRRLESFRNEMSYNEREQIDEIIKAIQEVHDKFLHDVMGGGQ
jgi:hypothetical protein